MVDSFLKRKKDVLDKNDKSSKQSWDKKIVKLCEKVNRLDNYYTTSSCAGRVVLIKDKDKKGEGLFLKVYHDLISFKELKGDLREFCFDCPTKLPRPPTPRLRSQARDINKTVNKKTESEMIKKAEGKLVDVKFKQEPPIIHIACRELKDAEVLLEKARSVGFKRGGIISVSKSKVVVELLSTEKLEFPIVLGGEVLVSDDFLKVVVKKANENLKKGWDKIDKLKRLV